MAVYDPAIEVIIADMIESYQFLQEPPLCYYVPLKQINDESGSTLSGRYLKHRGVAVGTMRPKLQDTYLTGGTSTGRAFDAIQGGAAWIANNKPTAAGKLRLLFNNGGATAGPFEVVSHTTTSNIENAQIIVGRGVPASGVTYSATNFNCYLHLAYKQKEDYRIALEWGSPIRLERTIDSGATWGAVDIAANLGDWQTYAKNHGPEIAFTVHADYNDFSLSVEVGQGNFLYFAPQSGSGGLLPSVGNIRLVGVNGYATLEYYPLRADKVTANAKTRDFGRPLPNAASAFMVGNSRVAADSSQTVTPSLSGNGQTLTASVTAQLPDAGDGLGSATPPVLSDFSVVVPATWIGGSGGGARYGYLPRAARGRTANFRHHHADAAQFSAGHGLQSVRAVCGRLRSCRGSDCRQH